MASPDQQREQDQLVLLEARDPPMKQQEVQQKVDRNGLNNPVLNEVSSEAKATSVVENRQRQSDGELREQQGKQEFYQADDATLNPKGNHLKKNSGVYNELVCGTFVLSKLFQMEDVYDWKLGMERRHDFFKFDDIVVGIQPKKEDEMCYYAFQLKGCLEPKAFGPEAMFEELKPPNVKNLRKDWQLKVFFEKGYLTMPEYARKQTSNFVIFTQYRYDPSRKVNSESPLRMLDAEEKLKYGVVFSMLPNSDDIQAMDIDVEKASVWYISDELKQKEANAFLSKTLVIASAPRPQVINEFGSGISMNWELMKSKVDTFKNLEDSYSWISKRKLLKSRVTFQGQVEAIEVGVFERCVGQMTLCQLFCNPKEITIGKEVRGLGDVGRYYIERTFEQEQLQNGEQKILKWNEEDLLNEKIVIIEGEPGLGKTVTIAHAAKIHKEKHKSNMWVIEMRMAELQRLMKKCGSSKAQDVLKAAAASLSLDFTAECLQLVLSDQTHQQMSIGVFLDGIDEVNSNFLCVALEWIKHLTEVKQISVLWVSARRVLKEEIEGIFTTYTPSYTIVQFTKEDQISFLKKFWNVYDDKVETLISSLLGGLSKLESLIGLPLITMMVADIYQEKIKHNTTQFLKGISLLTLFEQFIEKKFLIQRAKYFEIIALDETFPEDIYAKKQDEYISKHMLLALHFLYGSFPQFQYVMVSPEENKAIKTLLKEIKEPGKIESGLIVNCENESIYFLHKLFADYFVALWLFDKLSQPQTEHFEDINFELFLMAPLNENVIMFMTWMGEKQVEKLSLILDCIAASYKSKGPTYLMLVIEALKIFAFPAALVFSGFKFVRKTRKKKCRSFLHFASEDGQLTIAKLIIEKGADVNRVEHSFGETPLHRACRNGHLSVAELLIDHGADINKVSKSWGTPLNYAFVGGRLDVAEWLIGKEARVTNSSSFKKFMDNSNNLGISYLNKRLLSACEEGYTKVAQMLIEIGADVFIAKQDGSTPLHIAAKNDHLSIAQLLLEEGADINTSNQIGQTPLHLASRHNHDQIVKLLIEMSADVDLADTNGKTPLYLACKEDNLSIAKLLIKKGSDVNICAKRSFTPLHLASERGNLSTVKFLIEMGAAVNIVNEQGYTPLHIACACDHLSIAQLLIENEADINKTIIDDSTPLHIACRYGHLSIAQLLLEKGADVNTAGSNSLTPLHWTCKGNHLSVFKLLIENGSDIKICSSQSYTPLHIASAEGSLSIAKLLIEMGTEVNIVTQQGFTPAHFASFKGQLSIAQLLIDCGADVDKVNIHKQSPLHLACIGNHLQISELLLQNGADRNIRDIDDRPPLFYVQSIKRREFEKLFSKYA